MAPRPLCLFTIVATTFLLLILPTTLATHTIHPQYPSEHLGKPEPQSLTFLQPLDHFNIFNKRQLEQRYILDDSSFKPSSNLLFFYTCGEAEMEYYFNHSGGTFRDWAKEASALVIFAEHRFYGKSFPVNFSSRFDGYYALNLEQVVEDFAQLIISLNTRYNTKFQVVTAGGSWAGMVSAYMRYRYPHLVNAAIASSAPFLMMGYKYTKSNPMNFEYYRRVSSVIYQHGTHCSNSTIVAFDELEKLGQKGDFVQIQQKLHLCTPPKDFSQVQLISLEIREGYAGLVQSNHPNDDPERSWPVSLACARVSAYTGPSKGLALLGDTIMIDLYGELNNENPCYGLLGYDSNNNIKKRIKSMERLSTRTRNHTDGLRGPDDDSWGFQMCTQTMYYQNSNGKTDLFNELIASSETLYTQCESTYGIDGRQTWGKLSTDWAAYPKQWVNSGISNILFTNGLWDPWGCAGMQTSLSDSLISINIPHASHHLDLNAKTVDDTDVIKAVRQLEFDILMEMIQEKPDQNMLRRYREVADTRYPSLDCPKELYPNYF